MNLLTEILTESAKYISNHSYTVKITRGIIIHYIQGKHSYILRCRRKTTAYWYKIGSNVRFWFKNELRCFSTKEKIIMLKQPTLLCKRVHVNDYLFDAFSLYITLFLFEGCETFVYGSSCNISCPTNCKENTCHIQHGTCFACKPGWSEMHCNTSKLDKIIQLISMFWSSILILCKQRVKTD